MCCDGVQLERVTSYKYLGVMVDCKLSFRENTECIYSNVVKRLRVLSQARHYLSQEISLHLYRQLILLLDFDDIPKRIPLDETHNDHGRSLLNVLIQTKMCILNGCINPLAEGYTSISHRGKSVVDYIIVPHHNIECVTNFKVLSISSLTIGCRQSWFCL